MKVEPLRVLIVDDSRIFRGVIEETLASRRDVRVVGSVWSGAKAIEFARTSLPDFVTLDIEMPGMGGIETLKALRELSQAQRRPLGVLLISSYTRRGAAVTMEGLQEGAFDFITKPEGPDVAANTESLRRQLFDKIDAYRPHLLLEPAAKLPPIRPALTVRRATRFRAVVIASSTGGPEALARLLPVLTSACPVPIFLVQHLPTDFTQYFASSMSRRCGTRVVEATEGTVPEPGVVYVANGGRHLILNVRNGNVAIGFSDSPPENGCCPSADVLFRSASLAYGGHVLAVVLTGMGSDGTKGAAALKQAGAHIVVQDESTSIVWGMPGSVVAAKAADEVLPISEIGQTLLRHLGIRD
jgi:two-component system chemotaxis response regulator CheB